MGTTDLTSKINNNNSCANAAKTTANGKPKEKRRNNEKRKEKSRDAARCRRSRETEIFTELAEVLPLKKDDVLQLDKASVMRIAIAYLKIREMLQLFPKIQAMCQEDHPNKEKSNKNVKEDDDTDSQMQCDEKVDLLKCPESSQLLKQSLDGFLLVLSRDGDITYVSENVCEYLGIAKIDMLGQSIWEYMHQCDHAELKDALNIKRHASVAAEKIKDENAANDGGLSTYHHDLFIRFKCTLTSRGRSINIKSASYKVIHLTGHLVTNDKGDEAFVGIGCPIPHPSNIEIPLGTTTFLTKHSLDMKFTYVDEKMYNLLHYKPEDLLQKSLYDYQHGGDSECLLKSFKSVLGKGQGETSRYRFLGKYGGYCWLVTQATIVYDKLKPQSVVCVNFVISQLENNNEIYSLQQYEEAQNNKQKINKIDDKQHIKTTTTIALNDDQLNANQQELELKQTFNSLNITKHDNYNKNNNNKHNSSITENNKSIIDDIETQNTAQTSTPQAALVHIKNEPIVVTPTPTTTTKIVYKPIINATESQQQQTSQPLLKSHKPSNIEEKRPKSVTASVFRVAPNKPSAIPINNNNSKPPTSTAISLNSLPNALPSSPSGAAAAARAAQSVTASVLTPITQLANKNFTNFNRPLTTTTTTAAILAQQPRQQQPPQPPQQQQQQQQQQQAMNKGFLSFAEDATELTMLKEEPDDLSHMTSTAVDTCLPLDENAPLFGEMLVGLMGTYGGLLTDDINSLDSTSSGTGADAVAATAQQQQSGNNGYNNNSLNALNSSNSNQNDNSGIMDPFNLYRDDSNDTNCSQHLLSPSVMSKSPEGSSLPSLCSPDSLSQEADFALTMNELNMRAPYIPMDESDDLPLITDDLMWCSSGAFTTEELNLSKDVDTLHQLSMHHLQQLPQQQQQHQHQMQQQQGYYSASQQEQGRFSNSLCSSPASTISSLSPSSPLQHSTQQQQHISGNVFCSDSSELAALLGGTGNGTLSILSNNNNNHRNGHNSNNDDSGTCNVNSYDDGNQLVGGMVDSIENRQQQSSNGNDELEESYKTQLIERLQQQFGQQENDLLGLSIDCKKEKFIGSPMTASSLCDSIEDAFEVYNKESSNNLSYCWGELLQLEQQQQLQQQQQHNIIINAVPLITIQNNNNKNIIIQQQQQLQQQQKMLVNDEILMATNNDLTNCNNVGNNNNNSNSNNVANNISKISTIKLVNGTTAAITPITTKATIRLIENKLPLQQQQQQQQQKTKASSTLQQQHGNKRHLLVGSQVESKRLKSNDLSSSLSIAQKTTTPQLLKQLINGNENLNELQQYEQQQQQEQEQQQQMFLQSKQQRKHVASNSNTAAGSFFAMDCNQQQQKQQQQQQQQSHSVLKNLLISGCDDELLPCGDDEPMLLDENSLEPLAIPIPLSLEMPTLSPPTCVTSTLIKPLLCSPDAAGGSVLRNNSHNPMIGGTSGLLSPPFANIYNEDSNPPGLAACEHVDSASDSGIDDISETMSPMKQFVGDAEESPNIIKCLNGGSGNAVPLLTPILTETATIPAQAVQSAPKQLVNEKPSVMGKTSRKSSISFMDSSNPFATPLLMELSNDDYNMNTRQTLEDNDLEQVLGTWTQQIA